MRVLVTGGTGFLGRRLVEELAPRHALRLLVRPRAAARAPFPEGVELAPGDVTDRDGLARAVEGCDAIVHAAALVKILAPRADFERINVGGLENVLAAARAAGTGRVVYVSSFIALGPSERAPGGVLDESADTAADRPWINPYEETKTRADRLARQAITEGAPVAVVYPGVIYGPGEMTEGNIVVRHLLDLLHRRLPALIGSPERRWSYAYVEDVARGVAAVIERAAPDSRYVLGGPNVTLDTFYSTVERLSGVPVPRRRMPNGLASALGAMQKGWARLTGGTPKLTPDLVEVYRHDWAYDSARAEADLGYTARGLDDGLAATFRWLEETGQWKR